jgi:hypothetical protein
MMGLTGWAILVAVGWGVWILGCMVKAAIAVGLPV